MPSVKTVLKTAAIALAAVSIAIRIPQVRKIVFGQ